MHAFRRPIAALAALALAPLGLSSCTASSTNASSNDKPLTVLASIVPHSEILQWIDENDDSFTLDVKTVTDPAAANVSVADGSADANYFQHIPYLRDWESQTGRTLYNAAEVHLEPTSMYSDKVTSVNEIPDGATIVIPSSPSNFARGLLLLEANGLIELDADLDPAAVTSIDLTSVKSNPRELHFVPVDDLMVLQSIKDPKVYGVIAASALALETGYDPVDDAVLTESPENNPYTNIFVTREESKDDPRVQAVAKALSSQETADWIREKYGNAVLPVHH